MPAPACELGRLALSITTASSPTPRSGVHTLCSQDTPHDSALECDLGRANRPRVYLATSLTGNTGGGMFVDVGYLLRELLNEQGQTDAEIIGLFFLPQVKRDAVAAGPVANAHAALIELQHFLRNEAVYTSQFDTAASIGKSDRVTVEGPLLQRCIFMPLDEVHGKLSVIDNTPAAALAGDSFIAIGHIARTDV